MCVFMAATTFSITSFNETAQGLNNYMGFGLDYLASCTTKWNIVFVFVAATTLSNNCTHFNETAQGLNTIISSGLDSLASLTPE